ncbi:Tyrosine recombinase XerC [bioreactor metagenome]|uniref:Tyrosine recombinase XerC n=1 Tax=bioreactor metagenome TaxID=1076179 RepID=A0A644W3G5_9ZZZZ
MTASLQKKDNIVYVVLSWKQGNKRKQKWVPTELPLKYGKRIGEATRIAVLKEWEPKLIIEYSTMTLGAFLLDWVERKKTSIEDTTYNEYKRMISNTIAPYFDENGITFQECNTNDIETFYKYKMEEDKVSANTISHYQACIYSAFKDGMRRDLVLANPAEKVVLPKVPKFKGSFYTKIELDAIIAASAGTRLEIPIYLASWLGMRRGEIAGARWSSVDFHDKTLTVNGVVAYQSNGENGGNIKYRDHTKSPAGMRAFPLSDDNIKKLMYWKAQQAQNSILAGDQYDTTWKDFICVNELGGLISPNYISWAFPKFIKKHGFRKVRFHDLRHTNAVLLLTNGATMQEVQAWLGHEDFSTTDKYYSGNYTETKKRTAMLMDAIMTQSCEKEHNG